MEDRKFKVTYGDSIDPDKIEFKCKEDEVTIKVGTNRKEVLFDMLGDILGIIREHELSSDREDLQIEDDTEQFHATVHDMFVVLMRQRMTINWMLLTLQAVVVALLSVNCLRYLLNGDIVWLIIDTVLIVTNIVFMIGTIKKQIEVKRAIKKEQRLYDTCKAEKSEL